LRRLQDLELDNSRLRKAVPDLTSDKLILTEALSDKLISRSRRRQAVEKVRSKFGVSEWRACQIIGQLRSTQRRLPKVAKDDERLTAAREGSAMA
jgi:putative transposase